MKQRNHIGILVLLAAVFTGCQQLEEEFEEQPVEATWRLTVHASHSSEGAIDTIRTDVSRGIAIGEGESEASTTKLQSIWKDGEIVYVYKDGTQIGPPAYRQARGSLCLRRFPWRTGPTPARMGA